LENFVFLKGFWIGAQDSKGNEEFSWIETCEKVQSFKTIDYSIWLNKDKVMRCLCYSSNNQANSYYFKRGCQHEHYTLCESSQPLDADAHSNAIQHNIDDESTLIEIGTFGDTTYYGDNVIRVRTCLD